MAYAIKADAGTRAALFMAAFVWLVVGILYALVFLPTHREALEVEAELDIEKRNYVFSESVSLQAEKLSVYGMVMESLKEKMYIPYKSSDVVTRVEQLFRESGVIVLNESYSKMKKREEHIIVGAEFKVRGAYKNVKLVLYGFYRLPYIVNVEKMNLVREGENEILAELAINIASFNGERQ